MIYDYKIEGMAVALKPEDKYVIGISPWAHFDLETENRVYETEGLDAYAQYQLEHENDILLPGTAFLLMKALH